MAQKQLKSPFITFLWQ